MAAAGTSATSLDELREIAKAESNSAANWPEKLHDGREVFELMIKEHDWDAFRSVIAAFGEHCNATDTLILFSAPSFTTPGYARFQRWPFPDTLDIGMSSDSYHDARLRAARIFAEEYQRWGDAQRRRYHRAVIWSRHFRIDLLAGLDRYVEETAAGFEAAEDEDRWWYVRTTLLLMYATQSLPTFETFSPAVVQDAFDQWYTDIVSDYPRLRPTRDRYFWRRGMEILAERDREGLLPDVDSPFPDWDDDAPSLGDIENHEDSSIF